VAVWHLPANVGVVELSGSQPFLVVAPDGTATYVEGHPASVDTNGPGTWRVEAKMYPPGFSGCCAVTMRRAS
jgi:hypothetical protein